MQFINRLSRTDVYKMGHMEQYAPGTSRVYSYLQGRSDRTFQAAGFFGLQYYLYEYLQGGISRQDAELFLRRRKQVLGSESAEVTARIHALADLGYWPIEIKAVPEGTVLPVKNVLMTLESTDDDFHWAPGFMESLLLKVWYPSTCLTNSMQYLKIAEQFTYQDKSFLVHDFGYRSDTSEESAAISGAAHLIVFNGSDTLVAQDFIDGYYSDEDLRNLDDQPCYMGSVPATEHSVMCSYGRENEMAAFERMLELYPKGLVSIVSDTYSIWDVCTKILPALKEKILARDGRVVIRPDSGDPVKIICGDPEAEMGSPQWQGVVRLLAQLFGVSEVPNGNSPNRVLNPKVGIIYGDGMYPKRYQEALTRLWSMGFDGSTLVIGVGGILRSGTRDTLGMAIKATEVIKNGRRVPIFKDPVTDPGKKSHIGRLALRDRQTFDQQEEGCASDLVTVFRNGRVTRHYSFAEVRKNFHETVGL